MACTYSYQHERFGAIEVLEKCNARGLSIRVHEQGIVRVTVLPGTPRREINDYINSHADWLRKAKDSMQKRSHTITVFTADSQFSTNSHRLSLSPTSKDGKVYLSVKNGVIAVTYPPNVNPAENDVVQELARKGIAFALKVEGRKYLPQRLAELAKTHGFSYSSLSFKDLKSRWGSCSAQREICLNVQLMRLPLHLIDHVLLHELCHTVEMNHGPRFHALLDKVECGKAQANEREMSKWRTQYY